MRGRICRAGVGRGVAPGAWRGHPCHRRRPGAGHAAEPRSPRDRDRRCLPPPVRDAGRLGAGRAERTADIRHGGHRFEAGGCHASGVPHLRRRCRARRALCAHGREPSSDRCAGGARASRRRRPARDGGHVIRVAQRWHRGDARGRKPDRSKLAGRGRRRALEAAGARRHRHPWLGLRSIRHRRHRRP